MPTAAVIQLHEAESSDPLADLLAERGRVAAERDHLALVDQAHAQATAALARLDDDQREIDEAERVAWRAWVETPQGEPPRPLAKRREALRQRRIAAAGALAHANNAERAVAPRLEALNQNLREISRKVYLVRLAGIMAELPRIEAAIFGAHEQTTQAMAQLRGLHMALSQEIEASRSRGDEILADAAQAAVQKIEGLKQPDSGVAYPAILAEAASVREKLR
jgi:hypothetical protein